jgi:hypothetical protein
MSLKSWNKSDPSAAKPEYDGMFFSSSDYLFASGQVWLPGAIRMRSRRAVNAVLRSDPEVRF